MTPEELWESFYGADRAGQLKICRKALDAGAAASKCFVDGHVVEIDNLKRHIVGLSVALLAAVNGEPVDPVMVTAAENAAQEGLAVSEP